MRAFQPQNPRSIDTNTTFDNGAKPPSPAVMDLERSFRLDGTMGAGPAVAHVFSGLEFSRVVLDFLFCCHNLEIPFRWGTRCDRRTVRCGPFFHIPKVTENCDRRRVKQKRGRGPILRKTRAASKQGGQGGGVLSQRKTRLRSLPRLSYSAT